MERRNIFSAEEAVKNVTETAERLYGRLSGQPFSRQRLAEALCGEVSGLLREQSLEIVERLAEGFEEGKGEFERMYALPEDELEADAAKQMDRYLEPLSESGKRQLLLLLFQIVFHDSGYKMDSNLSVYLANMDFKQLKAETGKLLREKGSELTGEVFRFLNGNEQNVRSCSVNAAGREFSEKENDLIMTAAVYGAMQNADWKVAAPEQIGRQAGFEKSFALRLGEALRENLVPILLRLLVIAAAGAAVYWLAQWAAASEVFAFAANYLTEHHLWIVLIPGACAMIQSVWTELFPEPLELNIAGREEDARTAIQKQYDRLKQQADWEAWRFEPEYAREEETETAEETAEEIIQENGAIEL